MAKEVGSGHAESRAPWPKVVVIPVPERGFDPTEVAVPWKLLNDHGVRTVFAVPDACAPGPRWHSGAAAACVPTPSCSTASACTC